MGKWITPPTIPGEFYCRPLQIPNDPYLIGAVMGALWPLTFASSWEESSGGCSAADTAAAMLQMLWEAYVSDGECGGLDDVRQDPLDPCVLSKSADGSTWTPFADLRLCALAQPVPYEGDLSGYRVLDGVGQYSPDGGTTWVDLVDQTLRGGILPQLVATDGATDEIKLCLASTRAALVLAQFYADTFAAAAADIFNAWDTASIWLRDAYRRLLGGRWALMDALIQIDTMIGADVPTNWTASGLTAEQIQDLTCLLLENATVDAAGVVTFDWSTVWTDATTVLGNNPGTAVMIMLSYIAGDGLNQAGATAITNTGECQPCGFECLDYSTGFTDGLELPWFIDADFPAFLWNSGGRGQWYSAEGHGGGPCLLSTSNGTYREIDLILDLGGDCTVTGITSWWIANQNTGDVRYGLYDSDQQLIGSLINPGTITLGWTSKTWTGSVAGVRYVAIMGQSSATVVLCDDVSVTTA